MLKWIDRAFNSRNEEGKRFGASTKLWKRERTCSQQMSSGPNFLEYGRLVGEHAGS